jgi:predicted O-methyltransferase YrrM
MSQYAIANQLASAWRCAVAYQELGSLKRRASVLQDDPKRLISQCFSHSNGILRPLQREDELALLVEDVRKLDPGNILEIGTSKGGTLFLWATLAKADARIVSVDLRGGKFGGGYSALRIPIYRRFARLRQKLNLVRADSHDAGTFERVKELFGTSEIDFLFIDGDHTYDGVRKDWEMYSPLVRKGGLIAFHDIAGNYEDTQVKRFWDSIKTGFRFREYSTDSAARYGIGVLIK